MSHGFDPHQHGHHSHGEVPGDGHDEGLSADLPRILARSHPGRLGRRGVLGLLGGLGAASLVGCAPGDDQAATPSPAPGPTSPATSPSRPASPGASAPTSASAGSTVAATDEIPEEAGGPYPADGSNGVNVLTESGIVRSDLTRSFGRASGVAAGVPLTIRLRVLDTNGETVSPYPGAAIYLWHCDRAGNYSMYSPSVVGENYLRGVQVAGEDSWLTFTSIVPGAYSRRWPHAHFEVYGSVAGATTASRKLRTSQLALPEDICLQVYGAADGYGQSLTNLGQTSLDSDVVFSDGWSLQMASVTGSVRAGYVATLNVPV